MKTLSLPPDPKIRLDAELFSLVNEADRLLYQLDGAVSTLPENHPTRSILIMLEAWNSAQIDSPDISIIDFFKLLQDDRAKELRRVFNYISALSLGQKLIRDVSSSAHIIRSIHAELYKGDPSQNNPAGGFRIIPAELMGHSLPEPETIPVLMEELNSFIASDISYPALINAALIQAQFELIRPYSPGTGMTGRILSQLHLIWKKKTSAPVLQISNQLRLRLIEYSDRLLDLSLHKNPEPWIKFYLRIFLDSVADTKTKIAKLSALKEKNYEVILEKGFASSSALKFYELLMKRPVISLAFVTRELGLNKQLANMLIAKFIDAGVLKEITGQMRNRVFAYIEYLNILEPGK